MKRSGQSPLLTTDRTEKIGQQISCGFRESKESNRTANFWPEHLSMNGLAICPVGGLVVVGSGIAGQGKNLIMDTSWRFLSDVQVEMLSRGYSKQIWSSKETLGPET